MVIRPGRLEDLHPLLTLAESTFRDTFSRDMPANVMDDLMARRFTEARFRADLEDPALGVFVAEIGDDLMGYAVVRPHSAPVSAPEPVWELDRIYVQRAQHGQGAGEALMGASIDFAKAHGALSLWLRALATNARALAFYRRWGFVEAGREDLDLQGTVLPHLLLLRKV